MLFAPCYRVADPTFLSVPVFQNIGMCPSLFSLAIHDDISFMHFVIPGLTRNPVFSWIPAFAGMTPFAAINVAVYHH